MLAELDRELFLFLNSMHNPFFDEVMHIFSGKLIWAPLYIAILVYLGTRYRRRFWILLIFIALAVAVNDQVSLHLFKNLFQRLRPCNEPSLQGLVHLYKGECGGGFSFVSAHASNSFNVALLSLALISRRWYTIAIIAWASIIAYSRVYLGVHYPADIICGAMLGSIVGFTMASLFLRTDRLLLSKKTWFSGKGNSYSDTNSVL